MTFITSKKGLLLCGIAMGLLACILAYFGNPKNMALCVACFIRDSAGAMKLHSASLVQYFRPEIAGLAVGSFVISLMTKEYRPTGGSSPMIRFLLGFIMMIGSLVFLGCSLRMIIRLSAGDLNAVLGLFGFVAGIFTGTMALKRGFSLGRAYETKPISGFVFPVALLVLFGFSLVAGVFVVSEKGPGSMHAPAILSFCVAIVFGIIAQRCRTCFAGSIRDVILMKNFDLLTIIGGIFLALLGYNLATGGFHLSFTGQPIAHSQHLWNFLGLYLVGFAAVLAGGCPLRQMILAGQGSSDSAVTFLGLLVGAAFAQNFGLASAAAAAATDTTPAVVGGPSLAGKVAVIVCVLVLFIIGFVKTEKERGGSHV